MDKVSYIKVVEKDGVEVEHAIIDRGNGEFTSMLKSTYDAQLGITKEQAKLLLS
jgi:hypothetical protein